MHTSCSQGPVVSPYHLATPGGWHRKWHRQTAQAAVGLPTDPFSQGLWLGDAVFNSSEQLPYTFPESESYLCQERLFSASYSIIARSKVHWLLLWIAQGNMQRHTCFSKPVSSELENYKVGSQLGLCFTPLVIYGAPWRHTELHKARVKSRCLLQGAYVRMSH